MIVAVGDMNVDLIVPIEEMPRRGEQVLAGGIQVHGGGCAANFALACARLGAKSKLFAKVGDDIFGNHVLNTLKAEGVDVNDVVLGSGNTGATVALIQGFDRSFITYPGENANLSIDDINLDRLEGDLVHLPSFFLLKSLESGYPELMEKISSKIITFDTGFDPGGFKSERMEYLKSIIKRADIFFPNLTEAKRIMGLKGKLSRKEQFALVKKYLACGLEIIVIKKGEKGCIASDGREILEIPAFDVKIEDIKDTTGAGDVFNAGFAVSYLEGKSLEECCRFASAAAAISITGEGWTSYPTGKEVREFLVSHQ